MADCFREGGESMFNMDQKGLLRVGGRGVSKEVKKTEEK